MVKPNPNLTLGLNLKEKNLIGRGVRLLRHVQLLRRIRYAYNTCTGI